VTVIEKGAARGCCWLPELISRCRQDLKRYGTEDPLTFIRFLNTALKYKWGNREQILHETMRNLDAWKPREMNPQEINPAPLHFPLERQAAPLSINATILDLNPERLRAIAGSVQKVLLRKSFQLSLLLPAMARARESLRLPDNQ
jgi:hypothetical protein